jgi:hypothetical protein
MINEHTHKLLQTLTINQTIEFRSSEIEEYSEGDTLELSLGYDDVITVGSGGFDNRVDE